MTPLPLQIRFTGEGWKDDPRLLVQVERSGQVAIYAVFKAKAVEKDPQLVRTGAPEASEVIRIKQRPASNMFGHEVEAHEVYPSAKQFGSSGKYVLKLDRAKEIFDGWVKDQI